MQTLKRFWLDVTTYYIIFTATRKLKKVTGFMRKIRFVFDLIRTLLAGLLVCIGCLFLMFAGLTEPESEENE